MSKRSEGTIYHRRHQQPWPEGKPFKILSIDGGGIKGILPAGILKEIEAELCQGNICEYFDMIAGTSTGGILAIGLSAKESARDLYDLYLNEGSKIFPKSKKVFQSLYQGTLHDRLNLDKMVHRVLGKRKFGESISRMVIPAVNQHGEPSMYKTDHHQDYKRDHAEEMGRIALDTSAAPIYLGGHTSGEEHCLDGGLFANNPIMAAVVDAIACYDIKPEQIQILSIGCGKYHRDISVELMNAGLWGWKEDMLEIISQLQSHNAVGQAGLLIGRNNVVRINPELSEPIAMDDYNDASRRLPELAKICFKRNKEDIRPFFNEKVSNREKHYS